MTYASLKIHLADTGLFTDAEIHKIVRTCGSFTLGNAVIACEVLNIKLTGNDVDIIFA
jgi:hypothetical protein